ncbi:LysR substrate-binding domain-containing protein [Simkania negevensis]|uniref:HTH-type transcriptional regulator pecT n=1 Tax=Simkania negevensis (strain ATCC VR-1471 / DSM 27360 / Z) TaxID=331113 RepID=F8L9G7_SIMNZ|nr:LysR substrate-binding domain-containing protein [Simkania negevensis]CCB89504.1 HTH-type transcriptional regulator pecT [Simkania negevensis Z]
MIDYGIHCFIAVAKTKSFTRAADMVKRTQSAVTQQINKLERQLNKQLFHRGKEITLTKDGELFLPYAHKLSQLSKEVTDCFSKPELEGEITIGIPEDFATLFLSDILFDFTSLHPRIRLNVECDLTVRLYNSFRDGLFDIVVVKMSRPEDFHYGVEIWSESLEWVSAPQYLNTIDSINFLPLVLLPEPCVYRAQALAALEKANIPWKIVFNSPSYVGTTAAVKARIGVTALPKTLIPADLVPIEKNVLPELPDIHVSLLKKSSESPSIQTLESFILEKLGRASIHATNSKTTQRPTKRWQSYIKRSRSSRNRYD